MKKMRMRKFFAMLLTLAMVLGMNASVFASFAGNDGKMGTKDDTGTITVRGIEYKDKEEIKVNAYKIISANYINEGTTFTGYSAVYPELEKNITTESQEVTVSENDLTVILDKYVNGNGNLKAGTTYPMTLDGDTATASVPIGAYLVVVSGAEAKIYSPMVASVFYENPKGTENILSEGNVSVSESSNIWVKVSETPNVDKNISKNGTVSKGDSENVGDTIYYSVDINPIPYYGGTYPQLYVVDTLDKSLSYNNDVDVKVGDRSLWKGEDYTVTVGKDSEDRQTISVNFVVNGKYTLNSYEGKKATITYSVVLNDQAKMNQEGNENGVVLYYSKDSKISGENGTEDSKTYVYTFDIDGAVNGSVTGQILTKTGEENDNGTPTPLENATFQLYTDSGCNKKYSNTVCDGSATSNSEGQLKLKGLEAGTYYLKETKAPTGYSLNEHVYTIVIEAEYAQEDANGVKKGQLIKWDVTIDGKNTSTFSVSHTSDQTPTVSPAVKETQIKNTKLSSLPSTGGIGTTIFTIVGCIIMIAAASLYFASRKKSSNEK